MPSRPEPDRAQRLADVYARAERLRRQRRARLGTGALLGSLAVFMVGLLVGSNLGIPQQLTTIGRPDAPSITTTTERPTTTTTELPAQPSQETEGNAPPDREATVRPPPAVEPAPPPATSTPTTTSPAGTSTTVASCRNSRDPACGPFRFDPEPVNEPLIVEVTFSPEEPRAGERVTFTVRASDDGPVSAGNCTNSQTYGEAGEQRVVCSASCLPPEPRFGPWDPPPPENGIAEETFRHVYEQPGIYTATFRYGPDCSDSPWASDGETSVRVIVR